MDAGKADAARRSAAAGFGYFLYPPKPIDPTQPYYPRGLFTAMVIAGLLCFGIPALIELLSSLLGR